MTEIVVLEAEDMLAVSTQVKRGEIKEWCAIVENSKRVYDNFFRIGDIVTIYLGWGGEYVEELKGLVITVNEVEGAIELKGWDYSDYLVGPLVDKEYGDVDWGYIIRDIITTYTALDSTGISDVGVTTNGRTVYENREIWGIIHEILDEIDYDIRVNSDFSVDIYARETEPTYGIRDQDFDSISYLKDRSQLVNKVIIKASVEKVVDPFETTVPSTENWDISTGTWEIDRYNLKFSGAAEGVIFSKVSGYHTDLTTPIKQTGTWEDINIFFRRTETASENGYKVVIKSNEIELRNADSGVLLDNDNTLTFSAGTWYKIRIKADFGTLTVYVDDESKLTAVDNTYESGKIAFKNPASSTVYYDYITFETDTPVFAVSEDATSQEEIGIKEILLQRPEINARPEAQRVADLELTRRKYETSTLTMKTEGNMTLSVGDVVRFFVREPYIFPHKENGEMIDSDYLIIGIVQLWDSGEWTTSYELAQIIPELENILAMLRTEVTRGAVPSPVPKNLSFIDTMDNHQFLDNLKNVFTEYINQVGGSRLGVTWIVE